MGKRTRAERESVNVEDIKPSSQQLVDTLSGSADASNDSPPTKRSNMSGNNVAEQHFDFHGRLLHSFFKAGSDGARWAQTPLDLQQEMHASMKQKESQIPPFVPNKKYVAYRRMIVDWMADVGEEFQLQQLTVHSAVSYLDSLLNHMPVTRTRYQLVAICCILIAAKFEELDDNRSVPTIEELNECSDNAYTNELIQRMEGLVLGALKWRLMVVTPLHFLPYYFMHSVTPDCRHKESELNERYVRYLKRYSDFFVDMCLQEHAFLEYTPSMTAASAIHAARYTLKVKPYWPKEAEEVTGYTEDDIRACAAHIFSHYETTFPEAASTVQKDDSGAPSPYATVARAPVPTDMQDASDDDAMMTPAGASFGSTSGASTSDSSPPHEVEDVTMDD